METRRMWPEVIISGFLWLLVFWSLINWCLGLSRDVIISQLEFISGLETGMLTIISAVAVGASYFFGALANRLLSTVFEFAEKVLSDKKDRRLTEMMSGAKDWELRTHEDRYSGKLMFRSVSVALLFLFFSNMRWICTMEQRVGIAAIFIVLIGLCGWAFWRQKKFHEEFSRELSDRNR